MAVRRRSRPMRAQGSPAGTDLRGRGGRGAGRDPRRPTGQGGHCLLEYTVGGVSRKITLREQSSTNLRRRGEAAGLDARDARRRRARRRPARARARDHARRERRPARATSSSATSTRRPAAPTSVGVTGPPGVGKSSLIAALVRHVRGPERTVGVVSVDPSSPFTQGALLGDRIRLADHFLDPGVFIRSMGTRGHLGGLAEATLQALLSSTRPARTSSSSRRSAPARARSR